jgi:hypothetical protein
MKLCLNSNQNQKDYDVCESVQAMTNQFLIYSGSFRLLVLE